MSRETRTSPPGRKDDAIRLRRPAIVATVLNRLIDRSTRRQGFADSRIVFDWPAIVGPELAADTLPLKLDRRTRVLTLVVRPATAILVQHDEPLILERINAFFGDTVALRLRLVQGIVPRPAARSRVVELTAEEEQTLARAVAEVGDAELREALRGLGGAMRRRRRSTDGS